MTPVKGLFDPFTKRSCDLQVKSQCARESSRFLNHHSSFYVRLAVSFSYLLSKIKGGS